MNATRKRAPPGKEARDAETPRRSRWLWAGIASLVAGAVLVAPGANALLFGENATATVVRRIDAATDASIPPDSYAVVLEFRARSGDLVRVRRLVALGPRTFVPGDTLPVTYEAGRPEQAHLKAWRTAWVGGAGLLVLGGALLVASLRRGRRA